MIRSVAAGLGVLTALAVAATATPAGQALLGLKPAVKSGALVTVIEDTAPPVKTAEPAGSPLRPLATRSPGLSGAHPASAAPRRPVQGGRPQAAGVANILLNLSRALDETEVRPAQGEDSWSESKPVRKKHDVDQQQGGDH